MTPTNTNRIERIVFPTNRNYRYYNMHYKYVYESIKAAGITVTTGTEVKQIGNTAFEMLVNDEKVLIDFSDFTRTTPEHTKYNACLKFHYSEGIHEKEPNIYPFGPISFDNWTSYKKLTSNVKYTANNNIVLNNQRPYAGALERRKHVRYLLQKQYGKSVDIKLTSQPDFWKKINNCLVSVCVPGARNDMLDRGQLQYIAFGCCTISPKLNTMLPYMNKLVPGTHYMQCEDDYSDLIEKIEWCKANRDQCMVMGQNAKQLFEETIVPHPLWEWVGQMMEPKPRASIHSEVMANEY